MEYKKQLTFSSLFVRDILLHLLFDIHTVYDISTKMNVIYVQSMENK